MAASGPRAVRRGERELGTASANCSPSRRTTRSFALGNFLRLQDELTDTEDKVAADQRYYNATVFRFDKRQQTFPTLIVARAFSFHPREFFDAGEGVDQPVDVWFAQS